MLAWIYNNIKYRGTKISKWNKGGFRKALLDIHYEDDKPCLVYKDSGNEFDIYSPKLDKIYFLLDGIIEVKHSNQNPNIKIPETIKIKTTNKGLLKKLHEAKKSLEK